MFKRILIPGIAVGLAMIALRMSVSRAFLAFLRQLQTEYENVQLFRRSFSNSLRPGKPYKQ